MLQMPRSIAATALARMAPLVALIIVGSAGLSYWGMVRSNTRDQLDRLESWVTERVKREGATFTLVERTQTAMRSELLERLRALGDRDPVEEFDRLFRRYDDGVVRKRLVPKKGDRVTTGFIDDSLRLDADIRRRMVVFEGLARQYGPALEHLLPNVYIFSEADNMEAQYWPEQADWDQKIGPDYDMSTEEWATASNAQNNPTRETVWTGLYLDLTGIWMVSCSTPVWLDGRHIASIGHDIYLNELLERSVDDHPEGAHNVIFRSDGRLIAAPTHMKQLQAQHGSLNIETFGDHQLRAIHRLVMENPGSRLIDFDEGDAYLAVGRIEGPDWFFVTVYPKALIERATVSSALLVLVFGAAAISFVVAILIFVLQRKVSLPLQALTLATESVAAGASKVRIPETGDDEVGRLARSFNVMAGRVHELIGGLQARIREREAIEQALRRSEEDAQAVLNAIRESVLLLDREGTVLAVNEVGAVRLGATRETLTGTTLWAMVPAHVAEAHRRHVRRLFETGQPQRFEVDFDGATYDHTLYPVGAADRPSDHLVSFARDITDRRRIEAQKERLESELRQAQKMEAVGQLAGGVAHDFNNALTVILGNVELLAPELESTRAQRRMSAIRHSAEHATALTHQLLAFSRREIVRPVVLDLGEVVRRTTDMLRRLVPENVVLQLDLAADLPAVRMDRGHAEQVVINLVLNACDAMPDGGVLLIGGARRATAGSRTRHDPGCEALLTVQDHGLGMDADTLQRIFEPFFTTKPVGKGTGLGLSTVYGIVQQAGGIISVESEPGTGTTFRVALPAAGGEPPAMLESGDDIDPAPGGNETILLCEDDDTVRSLAVHLLESGGYTVLPAADGREALKLAAEQADRIQLLVTDVVMPGMSGQAVADALTERIPHLRVLFMSGYTGDVLARHGPSGQAANVLQKPFSRTALLERVRETLTT